MEHDTWECGRDPTTRRCLECKRLDRRMWHRKRRGVHARYDLPNLRALRERRGLRVKDLSRVSGVSRNTITHLERGETRAIARTVLKLSSALHVKPPQLIEGGEA